MPFHVPQLAANEAETLSAPHRAAKTAKCTLARTGVGVGAALTLAGTPRTHRVAPVAERTKKAPTREGWGLLLAKA